jgi:hypothetical protein
MTSRMNGATICATMGATAYFPSGCSGFNQSLIKFLLTVEEMQSLGLSKVQVHKFRADPKMVGDQ